MGKKKKELINEQSEKDTLELVDNSDSTGNLKEENNVISLDEDNNVSSIDESSNINDSAEINENDSAIENNEDNDDVEVTENSAYDNAILENNNENEVENISEENSAADEVSSIENDINSDADLVKSEKKKKSLSKKIIIPLIIFIALFVFLSTIFAIVNLKNTKIVNGVSIKGIDVSNMSKEDAISKVTETLKDKLSKEIIFVHGESKASLFPEQFEVNFDVESAVDMAYLIGRDNNIIKSNYDILYASIYKKNINPSFSFNEDSLNSLTKEMEANFEDRLIEPSYYVEGKNLIITKGQDGVVIDNDKLKNEIGYVINNLSSNENTIIVPTLNKTVDKVNLEKIHSEIYKKPEDAYYSKDPFVIHPHVDGIDFDISMEEAQKLLDECSDSCTIPLKVLSPKVKTNQIGSEAFPDLLGNYSTKFNAGNVNRSTNIRLAASKINGTIVMPGETFSYNKTVGQRTAKAGFKPAGVYSNGKVTTGIGGGICQVSSTLYNAVLLANLEIVDRSNHCFNPGYVPAGRDATVSWGGPDFVFKNTRNYPVRIVCSGTGGTVSCKVFGLKTDNEYDVEIQSSITQYISYKTITQNDSSLAKGKTKVIESGSSGCRSVCYRVLKQNGKVVSKTLLSRDTYNPHNRVVAVGTKVEKETNEN